MSFIGRHVFKYLTQFSGRSTVLPHESRPTAGAFKTPIGPVHEQNPKGLNLGQRVFNADPLQVRIQSHTLHPYVNFDGDLINPKNREDSPTNSALVEIGKLFNDSKKVPEKNDNLIAHTLSDCFNLMYHPDIRLSLLKNELSQVDLTEFGISPDKLEKLVAFQQENGKIFIDTQEYLKIKPLLLQIHDKIFAIILNIYARQELGSSLIQESSRDIARQILIEQHALLSTWPEYCNIDLMDKIVVGEFLGIVLGTNVLAFQGLEPQKYEKVVAILTQNRFFELLFYPHLLKPDSSLADKIRTHATAPATTQSPLRDVLGLGRYLPRYTLNGSAIAHVFHPVGLEFRAQNSLRGNTAVHCLYQLARLYFADKTLQDQDETVATIFRLYQTGNTAAAYTRLLQAVGKDNNPVVYELIRRFYTKFWKDNFKISKDQGFERIVTVKIGGLNFLADLDQDGYKKVSTIVTETFVAQRSEGHVDAYMIDCFVPGKQIQPKSGSPFVEGDLFQISQTEQSSTALFVGGDAGQAGGFNNGSTASDEASFGQFVTLGGLVPYFSKA